MAVNSVRHSFICNNVCSYNVVPFSGVVVLSWVLVLCCLCVLSSLAMILLRKRKLVNTLIWPRREKTCLRRFANNTGADQPAHPRSLLSAFVIRLLESSIFKHASSKISIF